MVKYIVKRILLGLVVLLGVLLVTFLITHILPVDAARIWAGPKATDEQIQAAKEELGLNKPLVVQFFDYIRNLLKGDLGISYRTRRPIADELKEAIPATLELVFYSSLVGIIFGLVLGIYAAKHKNKLTDHIVRILAIGSVSIPAFAFAIVLQLLLHSSLGLLPLGGRLSTTMSVLYKVPNITGWLTIDCLVTGNWKMLGDAFIHMILPAIPIAVFPLGTVARMTRSSLLEIMGENYIVASRSYGINERSVLWKHALKNTIGTTATSTALTIGYTLVNTFLVEAIFSWPGVGKYVSDAITQYNYPAIIGVTLFSTVAYLILNLIADMIVAIDPRVRL